MTQSCLQVLLSSGGVSYDRSTNTFLVARKRLSGQKSTREEVTITIHHCIVITGHLSLSYHGNNGKSFAVYMYFRVENFNISTGGEGGAAQTDRCKANFGDASPSQVSFNCFFSSKISSYSAVSPTEWDKVFSYSYYQIWFYQGHVLRCNIHESIDSAPWRLTRWTLSRSHHHHHHRPNCHHHHHHHNVNVF